MVKYKIDILKALADRGYTAKRLRKEKTLAESTMQRIRRGRNGG